MSNPPESTTSGASYREGAKYEMASRGYSYPARPPMIFKGKGIDEFLCTYEAYANSMQWSNDMKAKCVMNHMKESLAKAIQCHPAAKSKNWIQLKNVLLQAYQTDAEDDDGEAAFKKLLEKGFDINNPNAFLQEYVLLAQCADYLSEREKKTTLLREIPADLRRSVIDKIQPKECTLETIV